MCAASAPSDPSVVKIETDFNSAGDSTISCKDVFQTSCKSTRLAIKSNTEYSVRKWKYKCSPIIVVGPISRTYHFQESNSIGYCWMCRPKGLPGRRKCG